jgi:hypothetical protein
MAALQRIIRRHKADTLRGMPLRILVETFIETPLIKNPAALKAAGPVFVIPYRVI